MKTRSTTYIMASLLLLASITSCGTKKKAFLSDTAKNWTSTQLPDNNDLVHSLYLIGDAGKMDNKADTSNYVVEAMAKMMDLNDKNTSVVYLGDNIYPIGLVDETNAEERKLGEKIIYAQLNPLKNFKGETYIIPGNHDWNKDKKGGLAAINRQEDFIAEKFGKKNNVHFYPKMGCGDPKVVKLNKEVVFIFIDSQWWLQNWKHEKDINDGCEITSRGDFLQRMEELFIKYKNKEIICFLHHPIKSNGNHGGYFSLKQHLFPLAELGYWVPLPVIGSLYPIYRQATGSTQDNTNILNQKLTRGLENLAKKLRINIVFTSGHEHGLEYYESGDIKYIVSGSGAKAAYIQAGGEAMYAREARGFAKVNFYKNFESWLEFYVVSGYDAEPVLEYRVQLRAQRAGTEEDYTKYPPITATDTLIAANPEFAAGAFKRMMLGKQYRKMWTTPVNAELIDLETKYGGLTPIKKGGGMSSNSLRMQHDSGKQYILRSIKKDYRKLVPEDFENLELLDIMKDQNSASHPYAALALPELSKAAGIFYTHPKLVYLKHQKGLGNYNNQFPEELYLLEERPSGDWSDDPKFGNSSEIISYNDLLKNLRTKKHHIVDQQWVLKSRLFDLWIHDWDRHDDQWRWAKFKDGEETVYRPIPRDRDQAFYKFVGVFPSIVSQFLVKKFKTMKHEVKDVKNLAFNAKHFDRYFLNGLEWSEWKLIVQKLQADLTDEVIEKAMLEIPETVRQFDNEDIISKLKSRRVNLEDTAKKLYDFLSEEVEVVGTDNEDVFDIEYKDNGSLTISHFIQRKNKGNIPKYERTFYPSETKEVRIYGLRDDDKFVVKGSGKPKIKVRIIGGEGEDRLENTQKSSQIYVYDNIEGIEIEGSAIDLTSDDYLINSYDRNEFKYDSSLPLLRFGRTIDDGWWFGGGFTWTNHAWRKFPFKSRNLFSFSVAPGSQNAILVTAQSENIDPLNEFTSLPKFFRKLDVIFDASVNFPRYENYFGLGNNSINPQREIQYNWVRLQTINASIQNRANISNSHFFTFGVNFQSQDVDLSEGRVSEDPNLGFNANDLERRNYLGVNLNYHVHFIDQAIFPSNGFTFDTGFNFLKSIENEEAVTEFNVSASAYVRLLARPKLILANGIGYKKVGGDLQFHQYADLGNISNLRGFRNERFRGESAFYHNIDLRMHLFDWNNSWLPMEVGVLGGYDYGRVWLNNETSNQWHTSYTAGIWMNILDLVVVQPYYSFVGDDEGDFFSLVMGFRF
ncbi:MAG: ShlB/FhaC/HecB family hemolysin secretion/activation protein [Bacteroidota bacterium]